MRKPVDYKQYDSRWANKMYNCPGNANDTIKIAGCGPTCTAMVVASLKDSSVTPVDACEWAMDHGYRVVGGTANSYFVAYLRAYGIECEYLDEYVYHNRSHENHEIVKKALQAGNWVIANPGPGRWTGSGHFILVYGYQDGYVYINDPASTAANRLKAAWNDFIYDQKYYWIITVDGSTPPSKPEDVKETAKKYTAYVTPDIGLNVRSGPGTVYGIVDALAKGTKVSVVAESGDWARIGTNRWVCKDYLSKTASGSSSSFKNFTGTVTPDIGLNVRSGPGTNYTIVDALTKGTKVTVTGQKGDWYQIGADRWVHKDYISKGSTSTSKPSTNKPKYTVGKVYTLQVELKVRTGAGTNYRAKKRSELTADGRKHDKDGDACLDAGTQITCQQVKNVGSDIWIKCPSGWVAAYYQGSKYIK